MNRAIRHVGIFALILVIILLANLTYVQAFQRENYAENPANTRNLYEIKSTPRGQISAGGTVLASSHEGEEGFYHRDYPGNPIAFANVTGYLSDVYGTAGIEASQNDYLSGNAPRPSRIWESITGKEKVGDDVELTLNPAVQQVAYDQLVNNGYEGSVVALRPSTGEVLAMAQSPSFDPNALAADNPEESWAQLNEAQGNPLLNHPAQETVPPGSIYKIITTAAGISKGYNAQSMLTGENAITLPGTETQLTNYDNQLCDGGGDVTLATAFAESCNTAFVQMGIDAGQDAMREAAKNFGIGETYDLGLATSPGALGDIPDDAALGQTSIGQRDVSMSALQAAVMAATIANNGTRMEPHIVSRVTAADLSEVETVEPTELNQAVSPDVAAQITELMRGSEARTSGNTGADIASKTGTAEHGDDSPPHTWYVAFSPSEGADVAVAVLVKDGGNMGSSATGGRVASPIGRAVIDAARQAGL